MENSAIYRGDCFEILQGYIAPGTVDLIYADPPFFSSKHYEIIFGDGYERREFEDRWKGGIKHYIGWLRKRIEQCYIVLKDTGSIYVHSDYHAGHYIKVMLDGIFGRKNFQNEIIWAYKTGGVSKNHFPRKHDTIFFYTKSTNYTYNPLKEKSYLMHKYGFSNIEIKEDEGGFYRDVYLRDVWDIPALRGNQPEMVGYPTQKPVALLERIIKASSNPTDIVLDPFAGCGTTLAAAHKLGRRWVGIDISPTSCKLVADRLRTLGATPQLINMPKTANDLKKLHHFEFQNWCAHALQGRVGKKGPDYGIDGYDFIGNPFQAKQSEKAGRPVVDSFETALKRDSKTKGTIIAFSFTRGAVEEQARVEQEEGLEIRLLTVNDILKENGKVEL